MPQHPSGEPTPFGGPAGLLGGWSYLNDPEPCSLPSTVDMAAFKAGPSDTINAPCTEATPSGSSDSEGSNSSSSDSDSSSSSGGGPRPRAATAPGPRFSVTSSDSVGLRLKIAAIPNRTISKPKEAEKKNNKSKQQPEKQESEKIKELSSSDTSCDSGSCSGCSDSESASENVRTSQGSARTRSARLKRPTKKKANRGGSTSSRSESSESDSSEDSLQEINAEDLAAILPPEDFTGFESVPGAVARPRGETEDVAACDGASSSDMELPAQLVHAAIQRAESGSETEALRSTPNPQYASTLLQEFVAKTQILSHTPQTPTKNALSLHSSEANKAIDSKEKQNVQIVKENAETESQEKDKAKAAEPSVEQSTSAQPETKRKRGRPKKLSQPLARESPASIVGPNESPDSGILSNTHSPAQSPARAETRRRADKNAASGSSTKNEVKPVQPKLTISSLERTTYATERVLYPPRGRAGRPAKRGPGRPPKVRSTRAQSASPMPKTKEDLLDPVWREIDLNRKFRGPKLCGYKSDHGGAPTCSKKLAAQSGYVSDYGETRVRSRSGYRSDHSTKGRSSGYRSDFSTKAKSCGYRSDCSVRKRRTVRKKRKDRNRVQNTMTELDIMKIAFLNLGQSNDDSNSNESVPAKSLKVENKFAAPSFDYRGNLFVKKESTNCKPLEVKRSIDSPIPTFPNLGVSKKVDENVQRRKSNSFLNEICERVTRSLASTDLTRPVLKNLSPKSNVTENKIHSHRSRKTSTVDNSHSTTRTSFVPIINGILKASKSKSKNVIDKSNKNKLLSKPMKRRRLSSRSNHVKPLTPSKLKKMKKRRRSRSVSRCELAMHTETHRELTPEVENLIVSFINLCQITPEKVLCKEKPQPEAVKCVKRASKKRKGSENTEAPAPPVVGSKRRHKKVPPTQSPDEHKLPLKKRHYLLAPGAESRSARAMASKATVSNARPEIKEQKTAEPVDPSHTADTGSAVEIFRAHMDEAIEACISKYSSAKVGASSESPIVTPSKAVTPKKRHLLESPNEVSIISNSESLNSSADSELVPTRNLSNDLSISHSIQLKCQNQIKKCEISTRKKNRLEGLVSKIQPGVTTQAVDCQLTSNQKTTQPARPTVIRTPGQEVVGKPQPPPGVFEPSIDIELQIPVSTISLSTLTNIESKLEKTLEQTASTTKTVVEEINNKINSLQKPTKKKVLSVIVESLKPEPAKQMGKKRRRKTINRTGFPTKKKKKKPLASETSQPDDRKATELKSSVRSKEKTERVNNNERSTKVNEKLPNKCDRVPRVGEDTAAFIERSVRPRLSVVSLDKLQGKSEDIGYEPDQKTDKNIAQILLQDRPKRKLRDLSPADSILDEIALSKRQLRVKAEKLVIAETKSEPQNNKKRLRENSGSDMVVSKKGKPLDDNKSKKARDNSSDNEPLSSLIDRKKSLTSEEIKNTKSNTINNKKMIERCKTDPKIIITSRSRTSKLAAEANERSRSQLGNKIGSKNDNFTVDKDFSKTHSKDDVEPVPSERSERSKSRAGNKLTRTELNSNRSEIAKSKVVQRLDKEPLLKIRRSGGKREIENDTTSEDVSNKESKTDCDKTDFVKTSKQESSEGRVVKSTELRISCRQAKLDNKLNKLSKQEDVQQNESEVNELIEKEKIVEKKLLKSNAKTKLTKVTKLEESKLLKPTIYNEEKLDNPVIEVVKTRSCKVLNNRQNSKGNNKEQNATENVNCNNDRPNSRQSVKSLSKTSEINIIIPDRPKSRLSLTCLPTPPLESVDAIEQEPLPLSEGPEEFYRRDDSPVSSDRSGGSGEKIANKKKAPKWKKKYLVAGLLSDYYKDEEPKAADTRSLRTPYRHEDHPFGLLPPPPYCEKYFRRTVQDFQLPFDLWWQHKHSRLPGRDIVPSWNYRKIRTNVYYDTRPNLTCESQACSCAPDSGCPDECINRLVYAECAPQLCPCKEKCKNQCIQRHEGAPALERFMTENKGWGVRTKLPITVGSFILEYVGEVVTEREFKHRMGNRYLRDTHHYCLHLDGGLVIDGHRMGGDGRFVNHSCAPNCEMQKWSVNGLSRMALFALRDIKDGEELTYDYNFSLFNPSEGQPCRCGAPQCRGVIGGKSQRITKAIEPKPVVAEQQVPSTTRVGRPRKRLARRSPRAPCKEGIQPQPTLTIPNTRERTIIKESKCFMLRNLDKVRRLRDRFIGIPSAPVLPSNTHSISAHISALRGSRSIRTRGLALIEDDPEINRTAKLAALLTEMCTAVSGLKDETGQPLMLRLAPPSKKKVPLYFERIPCPIDLSEIEMNIETGVYRSPQAFDTDMKRLFSNAVKFYGTGSPEGNAAQTLTEIYNSTKVNIAPRLKDTIGESEFSLDTFLAQKEKRTLNGKDTGEDIIRCICGLFKDEGLMIQCSSCLVWQHIECIRVDPNIEKYICDNCEPRKVDLEIPLEEFTEDGHRYYLSLLRGELQLRQGDTVYVLRDIPIKSQDPSDSSTPVAKHTYETIGHIDFSEMDIFRVERLWKNEEGKRFVFGHHYLRPHETFHEPSRKFYPNEVVRVPLFEVVPIELVMARCWVLDPKTYCRGRPVDSAEPHVYICELRVDRAARLFTKISRHPYPVCTKNYAFHKFEQKLKILRTYVPHDLGPIVVKARSRRGTEEPPRKQQIHLAPPPPMKTRNDRRAYLESVLLRLMQKLPASARTQPPMDLSYLLTGRGARSRRPAGPNNS